MPLYDLLTRDWYSDLLCQAHAIKSRTLVKINSKPAEPLHPHIVDPLDSELQNETTHTNFKEIVQAEKEKYSHQEFLSRINEKHERRFWVRKIEFGRPDEAVKMRNPEFFFSKVIRIFNEKVIGIDSSLIRFWYIQGNLVLMSAAVTIHNYHKYNIAVHSLAQFFLFNANLAKPCPQITIVQPTHVGRKISELMYKFEMQTLLKYSKPGTIAFKCGSLRSSTHIPTELDVAVRESVIPVGVVKNPYSRLIVSAYQLDFGNDFMSDAAAFQEILEPNERSKWFLVARPGSIGQLLITYYKPPFFFGGYDPPVCRIEILPNHFMYANQILETYAVGVLIASDYTSPTCAWINNSELVARELLPNPEEVSAFLENEKTSSLLIPTFNSLRGIENLSIINGGGM